MGSTCTCSEAVKQSVWRRLPEYFDTCVLARLDKRANEGTVAVFRGSKLDYTELCFDSGYDGIWLVTGTYYTYRDPKPAWTTRVEFRRVRRCPVLDCHNYVVNRARLCNVHIKRGKARLVDGDWLDEVRELLYLHDKFAPGGTGYDEAQRSFDDKLLCADKK